jgi:hypothetical protein
MIAGRGCAALGSDGAAPCRDPVARISAAARANSSGVPPVQNETNPECEDNDQQHRIDAHKRRPRDVLYDRDIGAQNPPGSVTLTKDSRSVAKFPQSSNGRAAVRPRYYFPSEAEDLGQYARL